MAREPPPGALVELGETQAFEQSRWRALLLSSTLTWLATSSAFGARDDLLDGHGGRLTALADCTLLLGSAAAAAFTAGQVVRGLRYRWRHRRRG